MNFQKKKKKKTTKKTPQKNKSKNKKKTYEIVSELFVSRYQKGSEKSMKGSNFAFNYVDEL